MMSAISVPDNVIRILDSIPGDTTGDKLTNMLTDAIVAKLKECDTRIIDFESTYGMTFGEFQNSWSKGLLGDPHSYALEKDYMEWEGFCLEKERWFQLLKELRRPGSGNSR